MPAVSSFSLWRTSKNMAKTIFQELCPRQSVAGETGPRPIDDYFGKARLSKQLRCVWTPLPVMPRRIVFFQKGYGELLRSHGCLFVILRFQINAAREPANIGEVLFEFVFDWALHGCSPAVQSINPGPHVELILPFLRAIR